MSVPAMELRGVSVNFGSVKALQDIDIKVFPGEVHCLLGDNGAGKSTLIKVLSGVHRPSSGEIFVDGKAVVFSNPRDAQSYGVATVFQDLGMISLMSITRNFFLGREPTKSSLPFSRIDKELANRTAKQAMADIGIDIRDPTQAVGTLSGGERQSVAIARAVHFGAKVLILDEPTSALGVHQAAMVLKLIVEARMRGLAVIFISHNIHHAYPVGDTFTLLNRGRNRGTYAKSAISRDEVISIMSGGEDLKAVEAEIERLLASIGNRAVATSPPP
jgi:simple sugar transport system ATP-binding protein